MGADVAPDVRTRKAQSDQGPSFGAKILTFARRKNIPRQHQEKRDRCCSVRQITIPVREKLSVLQRRPFFERARATDHKTHLSSRWRIQHQVKQRTYYPCWNRQNYGDYERQQ
jgi:hypothetical protein